MKCHINNKTLTMLMQFVFEVVLVLITGCFGIVGNCLLMRKFMTSAKLNFHRLMITLAIYDNIYIALCMIVFALPELFESYKQEGYFYIVPKAIPVIQVALTGSVYCTVAISLERYLTVCHPFYIAGNKWSAKRYIIPIIIFSLLYNTSRFFELRTKSVDLRNQPKQNNNTENLNENNTALGNIRFMNLSDIETLNSNTSLEKTNFITNTNGNMTNNLTHPKYKYKIELTSLRKNKYYYSIYIIGLNLVFNGLVPFALLIILNTLLYKQLKLIVRNTSTKLSSFRLRQLSIASIQLHNVHPEEDGLIQSKNKRIKPSEIMLAKVSIFIVFVFIVCHSIRWIPNIYELIQRIYSEDGNIEWPFWVDSITQISHFLTVFNSSVNFYIYCITHYGIPSNICSLLNQRSSSDIEMSAIMDRQKTVTCTLESDLKEVRETSV